MPKVSVISPTYNHEKYVGEAIDSIVDQTFRDFELIVSDDCSTDGTLNRLKQCNDPRLIVIENDTNAGTSGNARRCWERSTGEYIGWLLTDDIAEPRYLESCVEYLDHHPEKVGVFGMCTLIDDEGRPLDKQWTREGVGLNRWQLLHALFFQRPIFCAPAGMVRRSVLEQLGYFPAHLKQINDIGHFIRILFRAEMEIIPEPLVRYRIRANEANISSATPRNLTRFAFEMYMVLLDFADHIKDFETLFNIFPEAREFPYPQDQRLIRFFLAKLALTFEHPSYRLFAANLIYNLLADDTIAGILRDQCGFGYVDLFELEVERPLLFEPGLENECRHLKELTKVQSNVLSDRERQIQEKEQYIAHLENEQRRLMSSLSWKLTAPIRHARTVLQRNGSRS